MARTARSSPTVSTPSSVRILSASRRSALTVVSVTTGASVSAVSTPRPPVAAAGPSVCPRRRVVKQEDVKSNVLLVEEFCRIAKKDWEEGKGSFRVSVFYNREKHGSVYFSFFYLYFLLLYWSGFVLSLSQALVKRDGVKKKQEHEIKYETKYKKDQKPDTDSDVR